MHPSGVNPYAMVLLLSQNCGNFRTVMKLSNKPGIIPKLCILLFLATLFGNLTPLYAQKEKKGFKKGGTIALNDSLTTYSQSDIFVFPNINKVGFYYDAAKLKKIQSLDSKGDEEAMYAALKDYVKNFGIENFN